MPQWKLCGIMPLDKQETMRFKSIPWLDTIQGVLTVLLGLWAATAQLIKDSDNIWLQLLYQNYVPIVVVLSTAIIVAILAKALRPDIAKRRIVSFLESLHERHFPYPSGGPHPDYRVTLFVPTRKPCLSRNKPHFLRRELKMFARSTELHITSRARWSIDESRKGKHDGIAGYAYVTGVFFAEDGLPDYDTASTKEKREYCKRTYITEEKVKLLNIKARSYRALVIKTPGKRAAVLMMESKKPDGLKDITAEQFNGDARHLQSLFLK